ncbi:MAG: neuraminidase-like domain-containing protein, partial [Myxococcota bacterium]
KRYRVWEAGRKIFLFPENWLEPEFRDDKTHLFDELEGQLFQDDVSEDSVDSAFRRYLSGLDELARLDIVAMHAEEALDPADNRLHVFGRTHGEPHRTFYRRYAHGMWTPWEPVTVDPEGDHLAPVVWRGRLVLFWVTFREQAIQDNRTRTAEAGMRIKPPDIYIMARLHWSEYDKGAWSAPRSSAAMPEPANAVSLRLIHTEGTPVRTTWTIVASDGSVTVGDSGAVASAYSFDGPTSVSVHVSKDPAVNGVDQGVTIHIGKPFQEGFYLPSRNSEPRLIRSDSAPAFPYRYDTRTRGRYVVDGPLKVEYKQRIITSADDKPEEAPEEEEEVVLSRGATPGWVLPCNSETQFAPPMAPNIGNVGSPFIIDALEKSREDLSALLRPVFYGDDKHTFFVEPSVTELTITQWQEWVPAPPPDAFAAADQGPIDLDAFVTEREAVERPPLWSDPIAAHDLDAGGDWLINDITTLRFGDELIGPLGRLEHEVVSTTEAEIGRASRLAEGTEVLEVRDGNVALAGQTVVVARGAREAAGLAAGPVDIVGGAGFRRFGSGPDRGSR